MVCFKTESKILFVIIVVDSVNIRTVRKKALIVSDWVAVLGNRVDVVAFMFIPDSWLSRGDSNDSNTLNFSSYTTDAEPVIFIKMNWLMLYKKIFVVYRENYIENIKIFLMLHK